MKIRPAKGQAFVQEDSEDFSAHEKAGLVIPEDAKKGVGTTGTVYAIAGKRPPFKVGQRVIFDRFIANDIYLRDETGKEIPKLRCLPIDCILGVIEA